MERTLDELTESTWGATADELAKARKQEDPPLGGLFCRSFTGCVKSMFVCAVMIDRRPRRRPRCHSVFNDP